MNNWIVFLQLFLISAGALSIAWMIKFTFPVAVSEFLSPLYLHIVVNGIIITIAATSRFLRIRSEPTPVQSQHLISVKTPPPAYYAAYSPQPEEITLVQEYENDEDRVVELKAVMVNGLEALDFEEEETAADAKPGAEAEDAYGTPTPEMFSLEDESEYISPVKPIGPGAEGEDAYGTLTLEMFSSEDESEYISPVKKPIGDKPEISTPEVREETDETLESAWKKITEGASRATDEAARHVAPPDNSDSTPSSTIWKEASPSQDELNRRVEAFIKKVNEEMRQRRQESLNQHMDD